jgi:hypothetical protein
MAQECRMKTTPQRDNVFFLQHTRIIPSRTFSPTKYAIEEGGENF